jgi:hypothetical protein
MCDIQAPESRRQKNSRILAEMAVPDYVSPNHTMTNIPKVYIAGTNSPFAQVQAAERHFRLADHPPSERRSGSFTETF